jgi:hypothetical protein
MISYAQALSLYNSRPIPPRSKKWKEMADNARPLSRTGDVHKGIHMTDSGTIYYRLYDTKIAILHKPDPINGSYIVECNWYDSITTNKFMHDFGLHYTRLETIDGEHVRIPQVPTTYASPHAHLTFTADDKLVTQRSRHADIYTATSTPEDKQARAEFRQKLDTLLTLAMFKLDHYKREVTIEEDYGKPFSSGYRQPESIRELESCVQDMQYAEKSRGVEIDVNDQEFIEKLLAAGQGVLDVLVNRRIYDADAYVGWHHKNKPEYAALALEVAAKQRQIIEDVTPEDFRKSLVNKLLSLFNIKQGTARTAWGQFQTTLPRKFMY